MKPFEYYEPDRLEEVITLLARHGEAARVLAGGTGLLVDMRHGECQPAHLVSVLGVAGLAEARRDGGWQLGACTTVTEARRAVAGDPALRGLAEACERLGARQVQNVATLGGNICMASPGADLVPPLVCVDAELRLTGPEGERRTPLESFLVGPDQAALRPAEVLTAIEVPVVPARTGTAFFKVMRRHRVDCSIVAVAARITLGADGRTVEEARVAVGAAGPHPYRARAAERLVAGRGLDAEAVRAAAAAARAEARPISDVRASADYRRRLVEVLTERAISTAGARAAEQGEAA